jgi:hypothetical protein
MDSIGEVACCQHKKAVKLRFNGPIPLLRAGFAAFSLRPPDQGWRPQKLAKSDFTMAPPRAQCGGAGGRESNVAESEKGLYAARPGQNRAKFVVYFHERV